MTTSLAVIVGGPAQSRKLLNDWERQANLTAAFAKRGRRRNDDDFPRRYFGASIGESRFSSCSRLIAS